MKFRSQSGAEREAEWRAGKEMRFFLDLGSCRLKALLCISLSRYSNLDCLSAALMTELCSSKSGWIEGVDPAPALGGWKAGRHAGEFLQRQQLLQHSVIPGERGDGWGHGRRCTPADAVIVPHRLSSSAVASLAFQLA